jgi:1-acyl-sn-glycerol-3-phosphate acyltransferase
MAALEAVPSEIFGDQGQRLPEESLAMSSRDGEREYTIAYPRRRIVRGTIRLLGRVVLPLAWKVEITGRENFPAKGPIIVVGNHLAVMEAVLMVMYSPRPLEVIGQVDVRPERISAFSQWLYGCIPFWRGRMERAPLQQAVDVLRQDGWLGIFPEGGFWDPGAMRPQTGVAWLSYRAAAPVLPIGFGGTLGALGAALRLERPTLRMNVGNPIPCARAVEGKARKVYLQEYAVRVMNEISALIPEGEKVERGPRIENERFELEVVVQDANGGPQSVPDDLEIVHRTALAKLLHRPVILRIFRKNYQMPIEALQSLDRVYEAKTIIEGAASIVHYLREENPYLLSYRFGAREAEAMQLGVEELLALSEWAADAGHSLRITPVRRYYSLDQDKVIVQTKQDTLEDWM